MAEAHPPRESWITGIGLVSCLGEGPDAHLQRLNEAPPAADATSFAPYIVHRVVPLEQIEQQLELFRARALQLRIARQDQPRLIARRLK